MIRAVFCCAVCAAIASQLPDTQQLRQLCRDVQSLNHEQQQKAVDSLKQLRAGAAVALGAFGAPARPYIGDLAKALNGTSVALSQAAAGALSDLVDRSDEAVVPDLVTLLVNRRPDCSFECFWSITALGKIGPSARPALAVLRQVVKDRQLSSAIQAEALASIRKIEKDEMPGAASNQAAAANQRSGDIDKLETM